MRYAFAAVCIASPLFAFLGTAVVNNRLVFFSDVLGHATLTGIAVGVFCGLGDPLGAMVAFSIVFTIVVMSFREATAAASETVLGVFFATVVALGVVLLSVGGGFVKFTPYLIGDILSVGPRQIAILLLLAVLVAAYWVLCANRLVLIGVSPSLARSRGIRVFAVETAFAVLLAVVVTVSIRLLGILVINGLLIVPAAAARLIGRGVRSYTAWAVGIGLGAGMTGLIASYYAGTASGATIVLVAAVVYAAAAVWRYISGRLSVRDDGGRVR